MGQRLNIEIIVGGSAKANCYFHWSAYTTSAISETITILKNYNDRIKGKITDPLLIAVNCFSENSSYSYSSGKTIYAGLSESSFEFMCEKYPDKDFRRAEDRNAGLIGCTEEDMEQTREAEEGRVVIDLDNEMIYFDVLWANSVDVYMEEMFDLEDGDGTEILSYPVFYGNLAELSFEQFNVFAEFVKRHDSNFISVYDEETCIISLVE